MAALVKQEMLERLPEREVKRRAELEGYVMANMQTFVQVGLALAEINQTRLYRSTHGDFESYCKEMFEMSRRHAYRLMDAAQVVQMLEKANSGGHVVDNNSRDLCPIGHKPLPNSESQVRPLLPYKNDQDKVRTMWQQAVETAPNGKLTASHVRRTVNKLNTNEVTSKIERHRQDISKKLDKVSPEFREAFKAFLSEVAEARNNRWRTTSREAALQAIDTIRVILAEDGAKQIKDPLEG